MTHVCTHNAVTSIKKELSPRSKSKTAATAASQLLIYAYKLKKQGKPMMSPTSYEFSNLCQGFDEFVLTYLLPKAAWPSVSSTARPHQSSSHLPVR